METGVIVAIVASCISAAFIGALALWWKRARNLSDRSLSVRDADDFANKDIENKDEGRNQREIAEKEEIIQRQERQLRKLKQRLSDKEKELRTGKFKDLEKGRDQEKEGELGEFLGHGFYQPKNEGGRRIREQHTYAKFCRT